MKAELQAVYRQAPKGIRDLEQLHEHLQTAVHLELSTIPPYLCALYSMREGCNAEAARVIRSVVTEEMLHITLAANVLNAIGGKVELTRKIPSYPAILPHSRGDFEVPLQKFSKAAIRTFLKIEYPAEPGAKPQAHGYQTIGQFYAAIQNGLKRVCKGNKYFRTDDTAKRVQVFPRQYYGSIGSAFPVFDLGDALRALDQIVNQGEGYSHGLYASSRRTRLAPQGKALAHYFRFQQILVGRLYQHGDRVDEPTGPALDIDWEAVYDMGDNPKAQEFPPDIRGKMEDFNSSYMRLLQSLERSLGGDPMNLMQSVGVMYQLKYQAVELMKIPRPDGKGMVGPSFESVALAGETAA